MSLAPYTTSEVIESWKITTTPEERLFETYEIDNIFKKVSVTLALGCLNGGDEVVVKKLLEGVRTNEERQSFRISLKWLPRIYLDGITKDDWIAAMAFATSVNRPLRDVIAECNVSYEVTRYAYDRSPCFPAGYALNFPSMTVINPYPGNGFAGIKQ